MIQKFVSHVLNLNRDETEMEISPRCFYFVEIYQSILRIIIILYKIINDKFVKDGNSSSIFSISSIFLILEIVVFKRKILNKIKIIIYESCQFFFWIRCNWM